MSPIEAARLDSQAMRCPKTRGRGHTVLLRLRRAGTDLIVVR
jgi:hypothetical protein